MKCDSNSANTNHIFVQDFHQKLSKYVFNPKPEVDSAIVEFLPKKKNCIIESRKVWYFNFSKKFKRNI